MRLLIITFLLLFNSNVYDYKIKGLDGSEINLSDFKGKKILIVNTASKCGYTPQYADLQKLYTTFKNNLVIIGFPADNFGNQEPGANSEIKEFCTKNYGVTFPMSEKVSVKGDNIDPLFQYLNEEAKKLGIEDPIKWNFTKFLLNENGKLIAVFPGNTNPLGVDVLKYIYQ